MKQKKNAKTGKISQETEHIKTQTFIDKTKGIVVRIIKSGRSSKIYVFPVHTIMQQEVIITLKPSDNKYRIPDINFPFVVNDLPEVDGVSVELV